MYSIYLKSAVSLGQDLCIGRFLQAECSRSPQKRPQLSIIPWRCVSPMSHYY